MLKLNLHPNPKKDVYARISNPVRKTAYLFALCATNPLYLKHKERLGGILDILGGLEYHIEKIRTYEKRACRFVTDLNELCKNKEPFSLPALSRRTNHHPAVHEAVAYIGRLGQLDYFFKSKWFSPVVGENNVALGIPSILALMPLRNKHSAHRQQDYPWKDDCSSLGLNEYGLKHGLVGFNTKPDHVNIQYSFPTKQRDPLLEKHHPSPIKEIEHFGDSNNLVIFTPTLIHQRIQNEAIGLLQQFFDFKP